MRQIFVAVMVAAVVYAVATKFHGSADVAIQQPVAPQAQPSVTPRASVNPNQEINDRFAEAAIRKDCGSGE